MKLHELIDELAMLVRKDENNKYKDVITEELIGGFQEDIEGVKETIDFFSDEPVIAITFRNQ